MTDHRQKEFIVEFVKLYQSLPSLWKVKSPEYNDRDKKTEAYARMIQKYREVDPNANRVTVIKKINSLRSVYRKEVAKLNKSIASGGPVYKPTIWYFDLFSFLSGQEGSMDSPNFMDSSNSMYDEYEEDRGLEAQQYEDDTHSDYSNTDFVSAEIGAFEEVDIKPLLAKPDSARKRKTMSAEIPDQSCGSTVNSHKVMKLSKEDEFDVFGKYVSTELRAVQDEHSIITAKYHINNILYEARLGKYKNLS